MPQPFKYILVLISIISFVSCGMDNDESVEIENEITEVVIEEPIKDNDSIAIEYTKAIDSVEKVNVPKRKITPKKKKNKEVSPKQKLEYNGETVVFSSYEIEDFLKWETVYKEYSDSTSRMAYSLNVDSTSVVTTIEYTYGHDESKKKNGSIDFEKFSQNAEIISEPNYLYLNTVWLNPQKPKKNFYIIISHLVADFEKWKIDFDDNRQNRGFASIYDVFLATEDGNNNMVTMILTTDNIAFCRALFTDPEVVKVLKTAGVIGDLDISYWEVMSYK